MKKLLSGILGWEWIQNYAARKAARAAGIGIIALAGKYKLAGLALTAFGLSADVVTGGLVTLSLAGLEALRIWAKDKP